MRRPRLKDVMGGTLPFVAFLDSGRLAFGVAEPHPPALYCTALHYVVRTNHSASERYLPGPSYGIINTGTPAYGIAALSTTTAVCLPTTLSESTTHSAACSVSFCCLLSSGCSGVHAKTRNAYPSNPSTQRCHTPLLSTRSPLRGDSDIYLHGHG